MDGWLKLIIEAETLLEDGEEPMPFWKHLWRALELKGLVSVEPGRLIRAKLEELINIMNIVINRLRTSALRLREMHDELRRQAEELAEKGVDDPSIIGLYEGARICKEEEAFINEKIKELERLVELLKSLCQSPLPDKETLKRVIKSCKEVIDSIIGHSTIIDDTEFSRIEDRASPEELYEEFRAIREEISS